MRTRFGAPHPDAEIDLKIASDDGNGQKTGKIERNESRTVCGLRASEDRISAHVMRNAFTGNGSHFTIK